MRFVEHTTDTLPPQARVTTEQSERPQVHASGGSLPSWPVLMTIKLAGRYLGISAALIEEYILDGSLRPVHLPRPETERQRQRKLKNGSTLRVTRLHKDDLDRLAARWRGV